MNFLFPLWKQSFAAVRLCFIAVASVAPQEGT